MTEKEYLEKYSRYNNEKILLDSVSKEEIYDLLIPKLEEYLKDEERINNLYSELFKTDTYKNSSEVKKYFFEYIIHFFEWGEELYKEKQFIEKFIYKYNSKFKKNTDKSKLYKVIDIKQIPIIDILSKYMEIKSSLKRNISCPFFHNDKSPSMRIYQESNTFYCFSCKKWWWIVELVSEFEQCSKKEAFVKIINLYK